MKCPFCSNKLRQVKSKSTFLDICPNCKGIWFDSGEFVDFAKALSQSDKISPKEIKLFKRIDVQTLYDIEEKGKFCPRCNQKMRKFNYSYDSNIFLDKCSNCGGIWADAGEVEQVAKYIKEDTRATEIGKAIAESGDTIKKEQEVAAEAAKTYALFFIFFPKVVIPLGSDVHGKRIPIVTISIIILCVLFFIHQILFNPNSLIEILEVIPKGNFRSIDLLTSMFLIGSLLHLIWDMLFLWLFGSSVEDRFSRLAYLAFFMLCGVLSSLLYCIFNWNLSVVTVSISGSVAGVTGAYFIFYPMAKIKLFAIYKTFEVPTVVCLGVWFLVHLVGPFLPIAEGVPKTAWVASIFGFLTGAVVAFVMSE